MSYVPNKPSLAHVIEGDEGTAAMAEGATRGRATPNSSQWARVEAENPIKPYMTAVLEGGDPAREAKAASERITAMLMRQRLIPPGRHRRGAESPGHECTRGRVPGP